MGGRAVAECPQFSLPGFACAYLMNSTTFVTPSEAWTTMTFATDAMRVSGMKSRSMS